MFYFFIIFLICTALDSFFFPLILFNKFHSIFSFYFTQSGKWSVLRYWISLSTFVSQFYLVLFYLSSLFFSIKLSWSHDIGSMIDMTWTYLMSRSWVSRDSSALSRAIFFICCCYHIFYCIIKFIKI